MGVFNLGTKILNVSVITCYVLVFIIDLLLLISMFKLQKKIYMIKALSIQLLLSSIFYCLHIILINFQKLNIKIICDVFHIESAFSGCPLVLSLLSLTLHSYFILTNNYTFHRNKQMILVFLILLTWVPSLGFVILFLIFRDEKQANNNTCIIDDVYYIYWMSIPKMLIEIITVIICLILLFKVCNLNVQNDKELQISKKKTVSKIVTYIIMIFVGIILKSTALIFLRNMPIQNYFILLLCAYFLVQNYVFVWNKQLKEALLNTFCCRSKEETEETMVKNNQKELAFKYEIVDDISQQNFDEEEEPSDN